MRRLADPLMMVLLALLAVPLAARMRREAPVEKQLFVGGLAVAAAQGALMGADQLATGSMLPLWLAGLGGPLGAGMAAAFLWRQAEAAKHMR
jgi:lipopolysaccharide export LptBFGC system permease protein LptF